MRAGLGGSSFTSIRQGEWMRRGERKTAADTTANIPMMRSLGPKWRTHQTMRQFYSQFINAPSECKMLHELVPPYNQPTLMRCNEKIVMHLRPERDVGYLPSAGGQRLSRYPAQYPASQCLVLGE